jgi:hypothetical protein
MGRWTFSLHEDGTYSGITKGCVPGYIEIEDGEWVALGDRLLLDGSGTIAAFAGANGFLFGSVEGRPTLTSETHVLTFFPPEISSYYLPDSIPPNHPDKRYLPVDHPETRLRAAQTGGDDAGTMSNTVMQTDVGFASTADHPNRYQDNA